MRPHAPTRRRALLVAALVGLFTLVTVTTASAAPPTHPAFIDSGPASVGTVNCITGQAENLSSSFVGWDASGPPRPDQVFYVHVWWAVTGNPCTGGAQVAPELFLPPGAQIAISGANPMRCFVLDFRANPVGVQDSSGDCSQAAAPGPQGGLGFYPRSGQGAWPTPQGRGWDIWVPVVSSGGSGTLTAAVWSIDGVYSPWAYPRIGITV